MNRFEDIKRNLGIVSNKMRTIFNQQVSSPANPNGIISKLGIRLSGDLKNGKNIKIESEIPYYAKYFIEGTKPHFPNVSALAVWCKRHGMAGAEWAVAKKISKVGTKPHKPAFTKPLQEFVNSLRKDLGKMYAVKYKDEIVEEIRKLGIEHNNFNIKL